MKLGNSVEVCIRNLVNDLVYNPISDTTLKLVKKFARESVWDLVRIPVNIPVYRTKFQIQYRTVI